MVVGCKALLEAVVVKILIVFKQNLDVQWKSHGRWGFGFSAGRGEEGGGRGTGIMLSVFFSWHQLLAK